MLFQPLFFSNALGTVLSTSLTNKVGENNMKRFLQGNWSQIRGKLKQKYTQLTDADLTYIEGQEEELIRRLQVRLDKTKKELNAELKQVIIQK